MNDKKLLQLGIFGIVIAALCCFTPVLVLLLAVVGLSAVTGYLDYVLLPALLFFYSLSCSRPTPSGANRTENNNHVELNVQMPNCEE